MKKSLPNLRLAIVAVIAIGFIFQSCNSSVHEKKEEKNIALPSTTAKPASTAVSATQPAAQKPAKTIIAANNNTNAAAAPKGTANAGSLLAQNKIYYTSKKDARPFEHTSIASSSVKEDDDKKGREEKDDGIKAAQEREFKMTRDPKLNIVPKDTLMVAMGKAVAQRQQQAKIAKMGNSKSLSPASPALSASNSPGGLSLWTERGPYYDTTGPSNTNGRPAPAGSPKPTTSGRMRAILVDKSDSSNKTVWVGGVDGGLWKTTDITANPAIWDSINDLFGNLAIADIVQDPNHTNIMYFGTGEKAWNLDAVNGGGVWKSTNNGATWALLPSTASPTTSSIFWNVSRMAVDKSGNVYVAVIPGILSYSDGNYLSGYAGLFRSKDGGSTWTNIAPAATAGTITPVCEMKLDSNTGRLHVVVGYNGANVGSNTSGYFFTDRPDTVSSLGWQNPATSFIPSGTIPVNVELAIGPNNVIYALPADANAETPNIYRSIDGGYNWVRANTTSLNAASNSDDWLSSGQGWYCLALGVDPANAANVIAGGLNTYRSSDSGKTWTEVACWVRSLTNTNVKYYVHADNHYITWKGNQVLLGCDGGLFYSPDGGATWSDRNKGLRLKQFYSVAIHPTKTNYFLGGAQDNGSHALTQPGLSVSTEVMGGDGAFAHIDQDEPQYQYIAYTGGTYFRSTNSGATWSEIDYGGTAQQFINPTDFDNSNNRMYTAGDNGQYVRWEDPHTGATFSGVPVPAFNGGLVAAVTVSPNTQNRVFFGTDNGYIVRVDSAQSATPVVTNLTSNVNSGGYVSCVAVGYNDNNLLATFSNYSVAKVWNSTDGGTTWTDITSNTNLPNIPVRWAVFFPEDSTRAMIATEMGIFSTDHINGASTIWVQDPSFPIVRTDMIKYRHDGTFAAATHGRGIWTSNVPVKPYVRFMTSGETHREATTASSNGRNYTDYTVNMYIDTVPSGNSTVNLTVAPGPTGTAATQGVDFDFTTNGNFTSPSTTLSFPAGATTPQPITVRVYDDIAVNGTRSFSFNYSVSGTVLASPSSTSYNFIILDNDTIPTGNPRTTTIWSENFEGALNGWQLSQTNSNVRGNIWDVGNDCSAAISNLSAVIYQNSPTTGESCGSVRNLSATSVLYKQVNATGLSNLGVTFTYKTGANGTAQTAQLVYSLDGGTTWKSIASYTNSLSATTVTNSLEGLPDALDNKVFYLGWLFTTTSTAPALTTTYGVDDITVSGDMPPIVIDSTLQSSVTAYIASGNDPNYFWLTINNQPRLIASLDNISTTLGSTTVTIDSAGNTWQPFPVAQAQRSQKVISIKPTTGGSTATYTVGLYYTLTELGGKAPGSLSIVKSDAATLGAANSSNAKILPTTATPFGNGYLFTANATGFSQFSLTDGIALPVTLNSFAGTLDNQNHCVLNWSVGTENNLSSYEVERSYDNVSFTSAGTVPATGKSAYSFTDPAQALSSNYYRLKMVNIDGTFTYSATVSIAGNPAEFVKLLGNPVTNQISLLINNNANDNVNATFTGMNGQVIKQWNLGKARGNVTLSLSNTSVASGVYILTVTVGNQKVNLKVMKN
ncbi:MAG: T9SS type A sorting domain-containing protein [Chitinophagaceae bacterium]|jgi:hypothetical protein|nr:T9SS type A sorting domain-containing protein [Chitinophagaceae bacterium]